VSARHLTVLPARLTPTARFTCADYRLRLTVDQCSGRYGGRSPEDPCGRDGGCPHGQRAIAAMMTRTRSEEVKANDRARKSKIYQARKLREALAGE